jgi:ABC-type xylose transport system permease subunit
MQRTAGRVRAARAVAIAADAVQLFVFPAFVGGWVSPVNDAVDLLVGAILVALVGWHWAFLPSFIVELLPGVDLIPTWTAATWLATRARASSSPVPR